MPSTEHRRDRGPWCRLLQYHHLERDCLQTETNFNVNIYKLLTSLSLSFFPSSSFFIFIKPSVCFFWRFLNFLVEMMGGKATDGLSPGWESLSQGGMVLAPLLTPSPCFCLWGAGLSIHPRGVRLNPLYKASQINHFNIPLVNFMPRTSTRKPSDINNTHVYSPNYCFVFKHLLGLQWINSFCFNEY